MAERSSASRRVGRYEIVEQLGRGGMAVVYLARQLELERSVALKELSSFQLGAPGAAERFLREARMAGSLSHPNIVTVHDYFEQDGIPYIAMEYVPRGSLRPYVGRLTVAQIAGVLEGVLAGLAQAEQAGIVHRDLKPENIMVTADGRVKIADFGIAKATQSAGMTSALTATGAAVGTPTYMAPEQAMAEGVGPWTDLYAVGVMAYEQVIGRPPFHGTESPMAMLMRHVNEPVTPAVDVNPGVDRALSDWIDRLVVKDPAERTQSASAAWDELEEILVRLLDPRWRRDARLGPPGERVESPAAPADDGFVTFEAHPSKVAQEPAAEEPPEVPPPATPPTARPAATPPPATPSTAPPPATPPIAPPLATRPTAPTRAAARESAGGQGAAPPAASKRRSRPPWAPVLAAVAVAAVVVAVVVVLGSGGSKPTVRGSSTGQASRTAGTSTARSSPAIPAIAATRLGGGIVVRGPIPLTTGGTPAGLAVSGRDVWLADKTNNLAVLVREDGSELRVPVGKAPSGVANDPATGNVWITNSGSGDVTVLDRLGNIVRRSIMVGAKPSAISVGDGAVWVAGSGGTTVTRIDPRTFATKQIDVSGPPIAIGVLYSRVWVGTSDRSITVLARDGSLNGSVPHLPGSGIPVAITASNGVWVLRDGEGLTRVDPRVTVAVRQTRPYEYRVRPDSPSPGADPVDVDSLDHGRGDNTIWLLSSSQLLRIGTHGTNNDRVLTKISVGRAPARLAVASHVVWVSDPGARALYEITY
jgi:YVTN family beta-propeller protein